MAAAGSTRPQPVWFAKRASALPRLLVLVRSAVALACALRHSRGPTCVCGVGCLPRRRPQTVLRCDYPCDALWVAHGREPAACLQGPAHTSARDTGGAREPHGSLIGHGLSLAAFSSIPACALLDARHLFLVRLSRCTDVGRLARVLHAPPSTLGPSGRRGRCSAQPAPVGGKAPGRGGTGRGAIPCAAAGGCLLQGRWRPAPRVPLPPPVSYLFSKMHLGPGAMPHRPFD